MLKKVQDKNCFKICKKGPINGTENFLVLYDWGQRKRQVRINRSILKLKYFNGAGNNNIADANIKVKWGITDETNTNYIDLSYADKDLDFVAKTDRQGDIYIDITKAMSKALQENRKLVLNFSSHSELGFVEHLDKLVLTTYYESIFYKPKERMIKTFDFTGGRLSVDLAKCNEELAINAIKGSGKFPINVNLMFDSLAYMNDGYWVLTKNGSEDFKLPNRYGKGWKLNYDQFLYVEDVEELRQGKSTFPIYNFGKRYTWVTADGSQVIFNEKYFARKIGSDEKIYDFLYLKFDKNYNLRCKIEDYDYELDVEKEIKCEEKGYSLSAPAFNIPKTKFLQQTAEKIEQLNLQKKEYEENIAKLSSETDDKSKQLLHEYQFKLSQCNNIINENQKCIPEIAITDQNGNVWGFHKLDLVDNRVVYGLVYLADASGNTQTLKYEYDFLLTDIYSSEGDHVSFGKSNTQSNISNNEGAEVYFDYDNGEIKKIIRNRNGEDYCSFFYQAGKLKAFTGYDEVGYFLEHNSKKCQRVQKASTIPSNTVGCSSEELGSKTYYFDRHCSVDFMHSDYTTTMTDAYSGDISEVYFDEFGRVTSINNGVYNLAKSDVLNNCQYKYPNNYSLISHGVNISTARNRQREYEYITENTSITLQSKSPIEKNETSFSLSDKDLAVFKATKAKKFVFSCRAKANSFKVEPQYCGLISKFLNNDEMSEKYRNLLDEHRKDRKFKAIISFDFGGEIGSETFDCLFDCRIGGIQFSATPIMLKYSYIDELESISVRLQYDYNNGEAQFFDFSLRPGEFSYEEKDKNGLVIKSGNSKDMEYYYNYEYNKDNFLTTVYKKSYLNEDYTYKGQEVLCKIYGDDNRLLKEYDDKNNIVLYSYDDNGVLFKKEMYNELDPTSRFVQESGYDIQTKKATNVNEFGEPLGSQEYLKGETIVSTAENGVKQVIAYDMIKGDLKSISTICDGCDNQIIKTGGNRYEKYTQGNSSYEATLNIYKEPEQININGKNYCKVTRDYNGEYTQTAYANGEIFKVNRDEYGLHNDYYYTDKYGDGGNETYLEEDYNLNGDITLIEDRENYVNHYFYYDEYSRPKSSVYNVWGSEVKTEYEYNNKNALSKKTNTVGNTVTDTQTYTYDEQNEKLLKVEHTKAGKETLKYDCLSRLTDYSKAEKGENKISKKLTYKKVGERTSNLVQSETLFLNDVLALKLTYGYDKYGRITDIKENGKLVNRYTYDAIGRIAREDNKYLDKTIVFSYDNSGNILERYEYPFTLGSVDGLTPVENKYSYTASDGDRLKAYNGEECTYDVLGNPTVYRGKDVSWSHVNRMDSFNGIKYKYNYAGIRTRKTTVDNVITKYYYAGENLLVENNGTRKFTYIYGADGISGFIVNSYVYYYLKNQLGDVCAIVDASGNIRAKYVYDAFGNHKVLNPDGTENISEGFIGNANPFRYRSYYYDVETGLYYLQSRYYDPETGRFITADVSNLNPYSINKLNLYCYANNKPIGVAYSGSSARECVSGGMNSSIGLSFGCGSISSGEVGGASLSSRNFSPLPGWVETLSTAIDHSFSIVNPIRTAAYIAKNQNLWNLMRLDGTTELPGTLSKVATGVGWGLGIIGGAIVGYEKYASGASLSSSISGGVINAGISIGGMYVATGLASLAMGAMAAASIPGGIIVVGGAVIAIVVGVGINHLFTKLEIGGNTLEGHLNNFFDWLIFWD